MRYATPRQPTRPNSATAALRLGCRSIPAAGFHSAELNGAIRQQKKFAGGLAKFLSAGQKETGVPGIFERRQNINTPKNHYEMGALRVFAWWSSKMASPLLKGCGSAKASAVQLKD